MPITKISLAEYRKLSGKSKTKYRNKAVKNLLGKVQNHSMGESRFAHDLYLELKAGKYKSVEEQVIFKLIIGVDHIANIIVDFLVIHKDGRYEIIEYKGFMTRDWIIKWKLLKALYPQYSYTLIRH